MKLYKRQDAKDSRKKCQQCLRKESFKKKFSVINALPKDYIVYFLHHVERTDDGHIKAKTLGKMLDSQLTVEGLFTNVIMTQVNNGEYKFLVHDKDGVSTVKTPIGLFETDTLDNDLKVVDTALREYYFEGE